MPKKRVRLYCRECGYKMKINKFIGPGAAARAKLRDTPRNLPYTPKPPPHAPSEDFEYWKWFCAASRAKKQGREIPPKPAAAKGGRPWYRCLQCKAKGSSMGGADTAPFVPTAAAAATPAAPAAAASAPFQFQLTPTAGSHGTAAAAAAAIQQQQARAARLHPRRGRLKGTRSAPQRLGSGGRRTRRRRRRTRRRRRKTRKRRRRTRRRRGGVEKCVFCGISIEVYSNQGEAMRPSFQPWVCAHHAHRDCFSKDMPPICPKCQLGLVEGAGASAAPPAMAPAAVQQPLAGAPAAPAAPAAEAAAAEAPAAEAAAAEAAAAPARAGDRVMAQFRGRAINAWRPAVVTARHADGTYDVAYDDGDGDARLGAAFVRTDVEAPAAEAPAAPIIHPNYWNYPALQARGLSPGQIRVVQTLWAAAVAYARLGDRPRSLGLQAQAHDAVDRWLND